MISGRTENVIFENLQRETVYCIAYTADRFGRFESSECAIVKNRKTFGFKVVRPETCAPPLS